LLSSSRRGLRFLTGQIALISSSWAHWSSFIFSKFSDHTNPRPHWTSTKTQVHVYIWWRKSFNPLKSHNPMFLTPSLHLIKQKNKKTTHPLPPLTILKSLTKNHNPPLYDWPRNFNGLLQFFRVHKNQGTLSWNASQQNPNANQPKHTLWEEFLAILETSKLLIIPLINHQYQSLDRNFASLVHCAMDSFVLPFKTEI